MIRKKIFAIIIAIIFSPIIVCGAPKCPSKTEVQKYAKKINDFFNSINTFRADFIEISSRGQVSSGIFILKKRPAMLKMDYAMPSTKTITVKKNKVIYYDKELKEKSVTSVYSSPLAFFLDSKINILSNLETVFCMEKNGKLLIVFRKKDDPDEENGAVALSFDLKPFKLTGWEIYKKSSQINTEAPIEVILEKQKINQEIPDEEFQ